MLNSIKVKLKWAFVKILNFFTVPVGRKLYLKTDVSLNDKPVVREMDEMIIKCKNVGFNYAQSYNLIKEELEKQSLTLDGWEKVYRKRWDYVKAN